MKHRFGTASTALLATLLASANGARAEELTVFATGSMAEPLAELGETFMHDSGHTLKFEVSTTGGLRAKLRAGETPDVIVIAAEAAAELAESGVLLAGTRRPFASALFSLVVRNDADAPDVATPAALKQAILNARTIAYPDPVAAAVSGGYIEQVLERLNIRAEARAKAKLTPMGYLVGEAVARGEVELGMSFGSEFVANEALRVVPFPAALQQPQLYVASVAASTARQDAALAFVAFITSPDVRERLEAAGVEPATPR